jgi:homoserine dehydrogenase
MTVLNVGLAGLGTVGGGTWHVCKKNAVEILRKAGREIQILAVAEPQKKKFTDLGKSSSRYYSDAMNLIDVSEIDVIVELIGGDTFAKTLVIEALKKGKHVVTANKALLAKHGNEIFKVAEENGVSVGFEAAVAGGIPILKVLREGLTANNIEWIAGIINGTTNYILSEMESRGVSFDQALKEAQDLGFAESDPTLDIEGNDSAHKLCLMASMAFGTKINLDKVLVSGIKNLDLREVVYAKKLGYKIKSLGIARRANSDLELRVHSTLIPENCLMANVDGAMNAVLVKGNSVGNTLYYGQGAGAEPTASAVVADLVDIARSSSVKVFTRSPALSFQPDQVKDLNVLEDALIKSGFYLRLRVKDQAGVLADITRCLSNENISISSFFQTKSSLDEDSTDVVLLTHESLGKNIFDAIKSIKLIKSVLHDPIILRVESLK